MKSLLIIFCFCVMASCSKSNQTETSVETQETYDYTTSPIHRAMIFAWGTNGLKAYYEVNDEAQLKTFEEFFIKY